MDEWLKELYLNLLEHEWALNDIDGMDICYYLELRSYKANKEYKQQVTAMDDAGL